MYDQSLTVSTWLSSLCCSRPVSFFWFQVRISCLSIDGLVWTIRSFSVANNTGSSCHCCYLGRLKLWLQLLEIATNGQLLLLLRLGQLGIFASATWNCQHRTALTIAWDVWEFYWAAWNYRQWVALAIATACCLGYLKCLLGLLDTL